MWYYIKENKQKEGPISDPAIAMLLKEGKIKPSTMVWSQHLKKWTEFKKTDYYSHLIGKKKNYELENFKLRTYLLRALAVVMNVLLVYIAYMINQTAVSRENVIQNPLTIEEIKNFIFYRENVHILDILSSMQFLLYIAIFLALAFWIAGVIKVSKRKTSAITMSKSMASIGVLVPIANIVLVPSILKKIYRTLEFVIKRRLNIVSLIFLKTWMYLWFLTWIGYVLDSWYKTSSSIYQSIYYFKMYLCGTQVLTIIMSIILVSIISARVRHIVTSRH